MFPFRSDVQDRRPANWRFDDEGLPTETSLKQEETMKLLYKFVAGKEIKWSKFKRESHLSYLLDGLGGLPECYTGLVASQSWVCFWILQSLVMLNYTISDELRERVIDKVSRLQNETGGFGGGPGQISHLATTYSAIHSIFLIGGERAYSVINKDKLYQWLLSLKQDDGSFRMSKGGEIDIRASYCVLTCASLLNFMTPELISGMSGFISKCQGFDGGLGCYPGSESHGGYTYCGLASLALLGKSDQIDISSVTKWAVERQLLKEGGFQGRTNKLVDGCYSFWMGGVFPILSCFISTDSVELYDREALKKYIVLACQSPNGGMRDKPGKSSDHYHTCYVLSGLSIAQHVYRIKLPKDDTKLIQNPGLIGYYWDATPYSSPEAVPEDYGCLMTPTHPLFNIPMEKVVEGYSYFYDL